MYSLKDTAAHAAIRLFGLLPVDRKKIIFMSYRGMYFNDSPKALYEEFLRRHPDYHYVWVLNSPRSDTGPAKVVRHGSLAEIYHLATARVWIDNKRKGEWLVKRKGQYYVQTWHGGIVLKKVEKDAEENLDAHYIRSAKHDSTITDLLLSGAKWSTDKYRENFWYDGEILEVGLPRSDIFYQPPGPVRDKVCAAYGLDPADRLILYAPTYRVDERMDCYTMDYERILQSFEKRFGGSWKFIVRLHANVARHRDVIRYTDRILDGTTYDEINELIVASDFLITDYSSCIFDALEAGKKAFLYATDIDDYMKDRGTYFRLEDLPAPLAVSNDELAAAVEQYDEEYYGEQIRQFMEETIQNYNNAEGSKKVVDYILKKISRA